MGAIRYRPKTASSSRRALHAVLLGVAASATGCASSRPVPLVTQRWQDPPGLSPFARPLNPEGRTTARYDVRRLEAPAPYFQQTQRPPLTIIPPHSPGESPTPEPNNTPIHPRPAAPPSPPSQNDLDSGPSLGALAAPPPFPESRDRADQKQELPPRRNPSLDLTIAAPDVARVGEDIKFNVTVRKVRREAIDNITVLCSLPDGLVFPGAPQRAFRQRLGRMEAEQERTLELILKCEQAGRHCVEFQVTADGVESFTESACVDCQDESVKLDMIGPAERTAGGRAEFIVTVANLTGREQRDVHVQLQYDDVLEPREASAGVQRQRGRMQWDLGLLREDERVQIQTEFACNSLIAQTCLIAQLTGRELPEREARSCLRVVPAGDLEISVSDDADPVVVGERVAYIVRVTNHAAAAAADLTLQLEAVGLQPVGVSVNEVDQLSSSSFDPSTGALRVPLKGMLGAKGSHVIVLDMLATNPGAGELRATVARRDDASVVTTAEPTWVNAPLGSVALDTP